MSFRNNWSTDTCSIRDTLKLLYDNIIISLSWSSSWSPTSFFLDLVNRPFSGWSRRYEIAIYDGHEKDKNPRVRKLMHQCERMEKIGWRREKNGGEEKRARFNRRRWKWKLCVPVIMTIRVRSSHGHEISRSTLLTRKRNAFLFGDLTTSPRSRR